MATKPHIIEAHIIYDRVVTVADHSDQGLLVAITLGRQNESIIDEIMLTSESAQMLRELLNARAEL